MKLVLFLLIFLFLPTSGLRANPESENLQAYYPHQSSFRRSVACGFGDSGSCLPISQETLSNLDSCTAHVNIDGSVAAVGALLVNQYADTLFFQELANRSVAATDCQLRLLSTPTERRPVVSSAWQIYQTIQPVINILAQERERIRSELRSNVSELSRAAQMGATRGVGRIANQNTEKIERIDAAIDQLLSQLPFGNHPEARAGLRGLAGRNISEDQFSSAFNSGLDSLKGKFEEAQRTFAGIRDSQTGYYDLDFSQYVELYSSPGARQLVQQLDPQGRSLRCRFDACYIDGPRNEKFAATVALVGITILTLGETSPFLTAVASVGGASLSATQIQNSCFQQTLNATAQFQSQCSAEAIAQTTLSQKNNVQCAVDVVLGSLDLVIPGAGALRKTVREVQAVRATRSAEATIEATTGQFLREGPDGARIFRNAEGVETTIFANGRRESLYPGSNIRVIDENGVRTTRYPNGARDVEENGIKTGYNSRGQATFRQNADGTIEDLTPQREIVVNGASPLPGSTPDILTPVREVLRGAEFEQLRDRVTKEIVEGSPDIMDQEIIIDILSGGPRKAEFFDSSEIFVSDAFRDRYRTLEGRFNQYQNRMQIDTRGTKEEIDNIGSKHLPLQTPNP